MDTNALVSAELNSEGRPGRLLNAVAEGLLESVANKAILAEHVEVLARSRFCFSAELIERIRHPFEALTLLVEPDCTKAGHLSGPDDTDFIAVACFADCPVIIGNMRHFPREAGIGVLTPAEAVAWLLKADGTSS